MESLIEPGKLIEYGTLEWKALVIQKIQSVSEDIKKLDEKIKLLTIYMHELEKQLEGMK